MGDKEYPEDGVVVDTSAEIIKFNGKMITLRPVKARAVKVKDTVFHICEICGSFFSKVWLPTDGLTKFGTPRCYIHDPSVEMKLMMKGPLALKRMEEWAINEAKKEILKKAEEERLEQKREREMGREKEKEEGENEVD